MVTRYSTRSRMTRGESRVGCFPSSPHYWGLSCGAGGFGHHQSPRRTASAVDHIEIMSHGPLLREMPDRIRSWAESTSHTTHAPALVSTTLGLNGNNFIYKHSVAESTSAASPSRRNLGRWNWRLSFGRFSATGVLRDFSGAPRTLEKAVSQLCLRLFLIKNYQAKYI